MISFQVTYSQLRYDIEGIVSDYIEGYCTQGKDQTRYQGSYIIICRYIYIYIYIRSIVYQFPSWLGLPSFRDIKVYQRYITQVRPQGLSGYIGINSDGRQKSEYITIDRHISEDPHRRRSGIHGPDQDTRIRRRGIYIPDRDPYSPGERRRERQPLVQDSRIYIIKVVVRVYHRGRRPGFIIQVVVRVSYRRRRSGLYDRQSLQGLYIVIGYIGIEG